MFVLIDMRKMQKKSTYITMVCAILGTPNAAIIFAASSCALIYPTTAHAYIDPGSGSVVMSTLLGIAAAVAYVFKKYFYKLKRLFRKGGPLDDDASLDGADKN